MKDILYDAEGVNLVNYWHQQCEIAENGNRNFDEENKNLKAEIERLKHTPIIGELCPIWKAEAVKEFAERLKAEYADFDEKYEIILPQNIHKAIDDILKETVGDAE